MGFTSLADIAERAREKEFSFWRVVLEDDCMFSQVEPEFLDTLSPEQGVVTVRPIPGMFTNDGGNDDAD